MSRHYAIMILTLAFLLVFPSQSWAIKIVVDAGHGGSDSGAVGVNGLFEKTVNLDIARKLRDILVEKGYEVAMTREDDTFIPLQGRVEFTNEQQADLFISIHANSYKPSNRGAMVLYYDGASPQEDYPASPEMAGLSSDSKRFAQHVLDKFVEQVDVKNQGLVQSAVYVVRAGAVPSILMETAFLSNKQDAAMLANDNIRTRMAEAIGQGIEAYMPPTAQPIVFPDTRAHWAREAILRMKAQGIVDGVGKQFQPYRDMTRAEWVTLLDRVFDLSKVQQAVGPTAEAGGCAASASVAGAVYAGGACAKPAAAAVRFKDAAAGHWADAALNKAVNARVLNGYEDGTLRPDRPVTRAEVAATFARLALPQAAASPAQVRATFADVPADAWSARAVYSLKQAGWIDGVSADGFMPDRRMTRPEAAVLLDRYLQSVKTTKPNLQH